MNGEKALRVLCVEDDEIIRFNAVEVLTDAGFDVLEARDSDEAMALILDPDSVDIVFTDVTMPGQWDGVDLVENIRRHHPTMPVIVTSGYAKNLTSRLGRLTEPTVFVGKPYHMDEIVGTLERLVSDNH